jgi:beta-glucanase (GH16 family)
MLQWRTFNFLYGRVEIRAKMPGGAGQMPALWMLGTDCQATNPINANMLPCNWPQPGAQEIDMTEILHSQYGVVNQQIHTATSHQGCTPSFPPPITSASQFTTYFLEWRAGLLVWSVQTVVNGTLSPVTETCRITGAAVPNTPMFLIVNAGQGTAGTTNGTVVNVTAPVTMQVDYVRVSP